MFRERNKPEDQLVILTETVEVLLERIEQLEHDSYLYLHSPHPWQKGVKAPLSQAVDMILDKLGLSLKRHPATQETFTLEDNLDVIRVQMHSL